MRGVQRESGLESAGLHQPLRPVLARFDDLPSRQSPLVRAAFDVAGTDPRS
jgi:hypothetical protein